MDLSNENDLGSLSGPEVFREPRQVQKILMVTREEAGACEKAVL